MFDISWTEFLLIGVVALIVIGPKELPSVMRTIGQWTRKARSMAADFQNQFQEAMREAEMADLKKQVDDISHDIKHFDPLKDVRTEVEAVGKDVQASLAHDPVASTSAAEAAANADPAIIPATVEPVGEFPIAAAVADLPESVVGAATGPIAPEAVDKATAELPIHASTAELPDTDIAGLAAAPVAPESADKFAPPDSTRRTG